MACYVDEKAIGEIYPSCSLDYNAPDECELAEALHAEGKKREACPHWRPHAETARDAAYDTWVKTQLTHTLKEAWDAAWIASLAANHAPN